MRLVEAFIMAMHLFYGTGLFLPPMKTSENIRGFLMFSGGIEREHRNEMG